MCVCVLVTKSCPPLWDPKDCSPSGFSIHGISQARILEWIAIPFPRGSSWPRDQTHVSCIAGRFFTIWATGEAHPSPYQPLSMLSHCTKSSVSQINQQCDPSHCSIVSKVFSGLIHGCMQIEPLEKGFGCLRRTPSSLGECAFDLNGNLSWNRNRIEWVGSLKKSRISVVAYWLLSTCKKSAGDVGSIPQPGKFHM